MTERHQPDERRESGPAPPSHPAPPALDDKVAFLRRPESYPEAPGRVEAVETHMAWVFLTDAHAFKLKKPVRYAFLDFSTLEARRADCEEEVRLNRRLAREVYLGTMPLTRQAAGGLRLGGNGPVVDWLVHMRRLAAPAFLDRRIRAGIAYEADVRRAAERLAAFYRSVPVIPMTADEYRARFEADMEENRRELTSCEFGLPAARVEDLCAAQRRFLAARTGSELLRRRVGEGRVIEAHGDLRPEHVWLGEPPAVIDCLEFRREFRLLDPADELAYLALECERLGASWVVHVITGIAWIGGPRVRAPGRVLGGHGVLRRVPAGHRGWAGPGAAVVLPVLSRVPARQDRHLAPARPRRRRSRALGPAHPPLPGPGRALRRPTAGMMPRELKRF